MVVVVGIAVVALICFLLPSFLDCEPFIQLMYFPIFLYEQ